LCSSVDSIRRACCRFCNGSAMLTVSSYCCYYYKAASRYYIDAAYCYSGSSVACLSVCLSVYHDHEPCQKTAEPIEMLIELATIDILH